MSQSLAVHQHQFGYPTAIPGGGKWSRDPHAAYERSEQTTEEWRVVAGKVCERPEELLTLLGWPLA